MAERVSASISRSLAPLRDVVASLSQASAGSQPSPNDRRRLVRRVRAAGSSALPALLRALTSSHEGEARWAAWLLLRVGPAERPRVAERVSRMLEDPRLGPAERARAVSLLDGLVDVGLEVPEAIEALGEHAEDIHALCEQLEQLGSLDELSELGALAPHDGKDGVELIPLDELPEPCQRTPAALLRPASRQPDLPSLPGLPGHSSRSRTDERTPTDAAGDEPGSHTTGQTAGQTAGDDALSRRRRIERRPRRDPRQTGFSLLERGDLRGARRALREAVDHSPDDGESRSYLGVCLLQLGEAEEALTHLEHAVSLCPDEALHHWNVASAAKATGRMCRAWLALGRYLEMGDEFEGAAARRREARRFVASYEKLIAAMHPGARVEDVVAGEERFQEAIAALSARRFDEAARGLREVVALLPGHYPSWGNLGAAEIALGNTEEADRCLRRALDLKPDYDVARDNLALIDTRH